MLLAFIMDNKKGFNSFSEKYPPFSNAVYFFAACEVCFSFMHTIISSGNYDVDEVLKGMHDEVKKLFELRNDKTPNVTPDEIREAMESNIDEETYLAFLEKKSNVESVVH